MYSILPFIFLTSLSSDHVLGSFGRDSSKLVIDVYSEIIVGSEGRDKFISTA